MIRNVVFDIGWVLMRFNYRPLIELLRARGLDVADRNGVMARLPLAEHECGRLAGHGLLEHLRTLPREPLTLAEAQAHWLDMFEPDAAMLDLAQRLAARYRVYLLSNLGDLHWAHLSRHYRLHALGHGALPSYLAGVMKPDPGIYREAERRFALAPPATVFVDDRADNVAAAGARGWAGIVHENYAATCAGLERLGVAC